MTDNELKALKAIRKLFLRGFRGNNEGTLNPTLRRYIDRGLKEVFERYVFQQKLSKKETE